MENVIFLSERIVQAIGKIIQATEQIVQATGKIIQATERIPVQYLLSLSDTVTQLLESQKVNFKTIEIIQQPSV